MRLFLASVLLVLHYGRSGNAASNCGLPTGSSPVDNSMWSSWHQTLKSQIESQDAKDAAGIDLLFYGDSLTELWRGTAWGFHSRLGPGIPAVFSRYFGQYDSVIAGAGGDTTANLWWRIKNGELPKNHMPKVVVMMVGANDLTAAYAQCGTWDQNDYYGAAATIAQQVQGIIGTIHETWPGTEIILLGILPRGTDYWDGGSGRTSWPNVLTGPIESLNRELKALEGSDANVTYVYCGSGFTTSSGINMQYIQDGQHPSVAGYEALGRCLSPLVAAYINNGSAAPAPGSAPGLDPASAAGAAQPGMPGPAAAGGRSAVASFSSATGPGNAGGAGDPSSGGSGSSGGSSSGGGGSGGGGSSAGSSSGGSSRGGPGSNSGPVGPGGGGPGGPGGTGPGLPGPGGPGQTGPGGPGGTASEG
ncbi:hypothetical protein CVIRNUC_002651 [Coccomyxa viridis]|uniref:SGNH hydrolase-type esterase domain-containing protein n=1 Tax=Coccomyxa viridis TaxID=1274662 RepID=A0AAV1HWU0_9CHLO|nr:hypothetical protein CVIRNUC_002651 [Coccomyxa viridis]